MQHYRVLPATPGEPRLSALMLRDYADEPRQAARGRRLPLDTCAARAEDDTGHILEEHGTDPGRTAWTFGIPVVV